MAASLVLMIGLRHSAVVLSPIAQTAADGSSPGYDDGRTRSYLIGMDVDPPAPPVTRALRDRMHTP